MKSYFELGIVGTPPEADYRSKKCAFGRLRYDLWWYAIGHLIRRVVYIRNKDGCFTELAPSFRDGCHRYWRRYK